MVDVQQGALGSFQQHPFSLGQQILHHLLGGPDARAELLSPVLALVDDTVHVQRLAIENPGNYPVFHLDGRSDPVREMLFVQQVPDSNSVAGHFVHVGRADALAGGADGAATARFFLQSVEGDVVRHYHMRPGH